MDYSSFNEQLLETSWNFMFSGTSGHREKYALSTKPLIILSIERGANILLQYTKNCPPNLYDFIHGLILKNN